MHSVLRALARRRPVFHSEADLRSSLAVEFERAGTEVRLETRPRRGIHLDLLLRGDQTTAIELKYLPTAFTGSIHGELFEIPSRGAQAISRYDVVKDIVRVESLIAEGYADKGWVVALSNDLSYWSPGYRPDAIDTDFRIHEGEVLSGARRWTERAGAGTTRKREQALSLAGEYTCQWAGYSTCSNEQGGQERFRYLALSVLSGAAAVRQSKVSEHMSATRRTAEHELRVSRPPEPGNIRGRRDTLRAEILSAARTLTAAAPDGTFTLREVIAEVRRMGSSRSDSTIRTHVVSRMCANAPDHHATTFDDLIRVDRGRYRLA